MRKSYKTFIALAAFSLLLSGCNLFKKEPKYTVTWKNFDGSVLEVDEDLSAGTVPTYDGLEPTKTQDAQFNYIFDGWTPEVGEVTDNVEYVAKFKEETRKYTVTWKNFDGQTLKEEEVLYGTVPSYVGDEPTKDSTVEHTYTFDGWSPAIKSLTENVTYTAAFKEEARKYDITWKNDDGSVIRTDKVAYGTVPSFGETVPTRDNTPQYAFTFSNWVPALSSVTGDAIYTASYTSEVRKYTITWANYDGTPIEVDENLPYGTVPSFNSGTPTRESTRGVDYTFSGWSPSVEFAQRDVTYIAQYSKTGYFSFDKINYEMEDGYSLSDIEGAPWINSNIQGEIDKIKKPALQDDFYSSVNYEDIKYNGKGAFEWCESDVNNAFQRIYFGFGLEGTTNGAVANTIYNNVASATANNLSNYLSNLNVDTYLSSKEVFATDSSLLQLTPVTDGYRVGFNDGYINGNYAAFNFLWIFDDIREQAVNIASYLSDALNLGYSSSEAINSIYTLENNLFYEAYNKSQYYNSDVNYTVGNLPWTPLKNSLLDLGLAANTKITFKKFYNGCFDLIYNDYAVNQKATLKNLISSRLAFDYRYTAGFEVYREVNKITSGINLYVYDKDRYAYAFPDYILSSRILAYAFPAIVEQTYIELESSAEIKARVAELIDEILEGYMQLAEESWLGSRTKSRMIKKLEHMKYVSCYADGYKSFKKLGEATDITAQSCFNIQKMYENAELEMVVAKNTQDIGYFDYMPSYTVNAFYNPGSNSFVILNGLAKGMLGENNEERLGMLGVIVGHEITHAFDSSGSYYDETGAYNDWWSNSDRSVFNSKVDAMRKFYNKIKLTKTLKVDGGNVDGEATADMGGMKVALLLAKKYDNFDYDKFFRAFANVWLRAPIPMSGVEDRASDEHPFNYLRANVTLAQFDEFVETYNIEPGDGMYIPEDQRIKIW